MKSNGSRPKDSGFLRRLQALRSPGIMLLLCFLITACAEVGPRSITAGRGVYAEVINRTEDEQLLSVIVRMRYNETFGMLSVASVTASMRFRADTGAEFGIGSDDDYAGNLVPFSAGIAYEESPTISYIPMSGEDFSRRMLSPVTLDEWHLVGGFTNRQRKVTNIMTQQINDLRNPMLGDDKPSEQFERFASLYEELHNNGIIHFIEKSKDANKKEYFWVIHGYGGDVEEDVRELLELIGIDFIPDGELIRLPVSTIYRESEQGVRFDTRSPREILRVFGAGIDVPAEHLERGLAEPVIWAIPEEERYIRIRSSATEPDNATVKIPFRDYWFYIDETDAVSKRAFMFLRTLIGIRLSHSSGSRNAPVLTVPVK